MTILRVYAKMVDLGNERAVCGVECVAEQRRTAVRFYGNVKPPFVIFGFSLYPAARAAGAFVCAAVGRGGFFVPEGL